MQLSEIIIIIFSIAGSIITSVGASGAIIFSLSSWLGKVWAAKILEKDKLKYSTELEKTKTTYEKELEKYKHDLEKSKATSIRYTEYQFKLYTELWKTLCKLKDISNDLWDETSWENLEAFDLHLDKTLKVVENHQLLLEDNHLTRLKKLLQKFNKYKLSRRSKKSIKKLAKDTPNEVDDEINSIVQRNNKDKIDYEKLLQEMAKDFKKQIKGI